jgi:glycosyltransferase involved in cell wall biosynthesis
MSLEPTTVPSRDVRMTDLPSTRARKTGTPFANPVPVLMTVRELHYGGIERDITKIALLLDRQRFVPHVATYQIGGMRFEELSRGGISVLHIPMTSLKSPSAITSAIRLRKYIRTKGIQLVHAFDTTAVFVVPIARALRVPAVLSSTLGDRKLLDRRSHRQMRWTDSLVDAAVVNCEAMRRHLADDENFPLDKIELCYNGLATNEFFPAEVSRPAVLSEASLVIGTVCVLRPEKALPLLQEAFAQVLHLDPRMKLLIVGSGPELPNLQQNAAKLGIAGASVFVPATRDVAAWMRSMDIFVLPSYSEAFSNSLLEAMACGRATVGSRVGGTPELTGANEERGLLFESGSAGDLALKLSALIADANLRRTLGSRAARFVRERLTIEIAAERIAAIYEAMLRRVAEGHLQRA